MNLLKRPLIMGFILLMVCFGLASSLQVMGASSPVIVMFEVEGNAHVPAAKILGEISNSQIGAPVDSNKVNLDMKAIMDLGYFSDVQAKVEDMLDGVKLVFEVTENPVFTKLEITGLTRIKPEQIMTYFSQKPGEVFNTVILKDDLINVQKNCLEKTGLFIRPKIDENLAITPDGTVKIELVEMRYGKIKITGLKKTKEIVVRRELSIKEGDIIDRNILSEDYYKLMRLRLFDDIQINQEQNPDPGLLDLVFDIKETVGNANYSFGFSYTPGKDKNSLSGVLGVTDPNLMGLGQSLSLDVNITPKADTLNGSNDGFPLSGNVQFSFTDPWFDQNHTSFRVSLWNSNNSIQSTISHWNPSITKVGSGDLNQNGFSFSFGRQVMKNTSATVAFQFEKDKLENVTIKDKDSEGNDIEIHPALYPAEFWDNSVSIGLNKNQLKLQDAFFVNGGYALSANYRISGKYLGGEFDYQKLDLEGKWFFQLAPNLVLGTRLEGVGLFGDYPDYDALYLGGMKKLRGYGEKRFESSETQKLIGNQYLLSNTELRYRLPSNKNLEFLLFYDIGQVNNNNPAGVVKYDYGVGFRYNVPFLGVLGFDYSHNAEKVEPDKFIFAFGDTF